MLLAHAHRAPDVRRDHLHQLLLLGAEGLLVGIALQRQHRAEHLVTQHVTRQQVADVQRLEEAQLERAAQEGPVGHQLVERDRLRQRLLEQRIDRHLATGVPYSNRYLGILRFRDGKACYWPEYINPLAMTEMFERVAAAPQP
jgi:ketosteroid isomerase-like protein